MLREAGFVAPAPGVVDDDRCVDAVGGVVDGRGVVGVDHLDAGAVRDDLLGFLVDGDRPGEPTVHGVAQQQGCALDEVVLGAAADDDGAQTQAAASAGVGDEDAGEQAPDAAEAVEHDVGGFGGDGSHRGREHLGEVGLQRLPALGVSGDEPGDVEGGGAGSKGMDRFQHGEAVFDREPLMPELRDALVHFDEAGRRQAEQPVPVERGDHVVFASERPDERDHPLRQLFALSPVVAVCRGIVHLRPCMCERAPRSPARGLPGESGDAFSVQVAGTRAESGRRRCPVARGNPARRACVLFVGCSMKGRR